MFIFLHEVMINNDEDGLMTILTEMTDDNAGNDGDDDDGDDDGIHPKYLRNEYL